MSRCKGGQKKLLAQCLAQHKPHGGHRGWPISYGLCCMEFYPIEYHPAEGAPFAVHRSEQLWGMYI
eukprot:364483-Chlamydomonas_euryale.AAC.11